MQRSTQLHYRYFLLSFSTAFLVMSLLFMALLFTVHPTAPKSLQQTAATDTTSINYVPQKEDGLTVLFILAPAPDQEADSFLLAQFDPVSGSVPVTALPPQTLVQNGGREEPLGQVYAYGGAEYACGALSQSLGITIHRYVRASQDSFVSAAAAIGSVEFELPVDITVNQEGAPVEMSGGTQLLDGKKALAILRYDGYQGGELARCAIIEDLAVATVNQRGDVVLSTMADSVFQTVATLLDTNISYTDYDNRKQAAEFLVRYQKEPGAAVRLEGAFSEDGGAFTVTDTCLARLRAAYN